MSEKKRIGDPNQITRDYFDSLLVEMRHIDAVLPDTALNLYGETFKTPVMMAALSHLDKCYPDGMVEMARGAKAANAVNWAGMGDEAELERITATGAKTIKIIKPYADNDRIFKKIAHAEDCGCIAVGMDIDHAYNWLGEYDNVLGEKMSGKTLNELKEFVKMTKLPFVLKGVLSVRDAAKCLEAGVNGIVVSHHHGIMDFAVPPLMVLPDIAKEIAGQMPIFVDCCVENGYDVFKALALGATAVSTGRAIMTPLSQKGADGVTETVMHMTSQLKNMMARTASPDIANIDSDLIYRSPQVYKA
ncbi:MAG: alpha-hydroxy-acid oxidizing protein [Lachnospiraceae bacterium]|nr:alpha-hydroxy-acid oxidizing protein [Lachnospiraceae bacterium]